VAVSPSYATFTWHVMSAPYSSPEGMYIRQGTKLAEELPRTPLLSTSVNKGSRKGRGIIGPRSFYSAR
jgi:hypothetical protein